MTATAAAIRTFRSSFANADPSGAGTTDFGTWDARRALYDLYWAFYQNSVYGTGHAAAQSYKVDRDLYKYTRGVYNPAYRLVEQWQSMLMGGSYDPNAGDGKEVNSCLPIETDGAAVEPVRPALARLLRDSHWQVNKGVYTRFGTAMGDVGLKACDDPDRGMVYLEVVHPGTVRWVERDRGFVKQYVIEERREDPRPRAANDLTVRTVKYTETAERDGEKVVYTTYLDDSPYPWNGRASRWEEPYGFTPLVLVQHNSLGMDWGLSEFHSGRTKIDEVNDLGSKLHDQIRKMTEGAWYVEGAAAADVEGEATRTGLQMFYGPPASRPHSLVAELDIAATSAEIRAQLDDLEDDYPELRFHRMQTRGDLSGEAIRRARQPVEAKVNERRPNYDHGLVRAMQMAVAIGGFRGYEGYAGFGLESYRQGKLDFRIGSRPVFAVDPLDVIAERMAKYAAIEQAVKAGISEQQAMREAGYSDADIAAMLADKDAQADKAMERQAEMQRRAFAEGSADEEGVPQ